MRVSPSQLRLFRSCQRAWYYSRHTPRGARIQTVAQALGDEVQDHLDAFLEHGTIPPLGVTVENKAGRIALSGLRHLPAPGPWNKIEYEFTVPLVEDGDDPIFLTGRMDCYTPSRDLIIDHKTLWSIERYAMTEEEFEQDPQRISYAFAHLMLDDLARLAVTRWVYYQTKKPYYSKVLEREDTRDTIDVHVDSLRLTAREMREKREDRDGCSRNFNFCLEYGGCDHFEQCYKDDPEGHDMSVIEELRAKAAKKKAGQVQPVIDTTAVEKPAEGTGMPTSSDIPQAEGPGPEVQLPPKRRGRPAGSKNKPKEPEAAPPAASGEVEGLASAAGAELPTEGLSVRSILKALRLLRGHAKALGLVLTYQMGTSDYQDDGESE
jgi:hypothetical protein